MLLRLKGVGALLAIVMMLHIAVLVGAVRHFIKRQVRNLRELRLQLVFDLLHRGFKLGQLGLEFADLGHQRVGAHIVLSLLGLADLLRGRVAPRLRLLRCLNGRAALFIDRDQGRRQCLQPAARERLIESVGVFSNPANVVHVQFLRHGRTFPTIHVFRCCVRTIRGCPGQARAGRIGRMAATISEQLARAVILSIRQKTAKGPSLRAKRSNPFLKKLDCFVASLLAMTGYPPTPRASWRAESGAYRSVESAMNRPRRRPCRQRFWRPSSPPSPPR